MNIVILDAYTSNPGDLDWNDISLYGDLRVYPRTSNIDLIDRAADADILVVNKRILKKRELLKLPKLKCICTLATGYNNIDIEFARQRNIDVCNAVGYSSPSVAQHTIAMLLQFTNNVSHYNNEVHAGKWSKAIDWTYLSTSQIELSEKNMGIYGYGKIGQKVGLIASAMGMNVLVISRGKEKDIYDNVKYVSEKTFFMDSDVISLHAPLTKENRDVINTEKLKLMKKSAILINTGRGGLINENDLKDALINEDIAGACLDVLNQEPPLHDHPMLSAPNCIITPHIAWATKESRQRLIKSVADNIGAYILGKSQNVVN